MIAVLLLLLLLLAAAAAAAAAAAVAAAAGCCCCCCNITYLASVSRGPSVMCMAALLGCNCSSNHNGNFQVYNINPAGDSFLAMQTTPQRLQSRKSPTRSSLAWMAIKSPSAFASLQMQCLGNRSPNPHILSWWRLLCWKSGYT